MKQNTKGGGNNIKKRKTTCKWIEFKEKYCVETHNYENPVEKKEKSSSHL